MINYIKNFIEWLEGDVSRTRKVVFIGIISLWAIITVCVFMLNSFGITLLEYQNYYFSLVGVVATIITFYTTTSAKSKSKGDNVKYIDE